MQHKGQDRIIRVLLITLAGFVLVSENPSYTFLTKQVHLGARQDFNSLFKNRGNIFKQIVFRWLRYMR